VSILLSPRLLLSSNTGTSRPFIPGLCRRQCSLCCLRKKCWDWPG
jgi:hypothetical protein